MKKKIVSLFMLVLIAVSTTACGGDNNAVYSEVEIETTEKETEQTNFIEELVSREPKSLEEFKNIMESLGYTVEDVTEQYFNSELEGRYLAMSSTREYWIEFAKYENMESAQMAYINDQEGIQAGIEMVKPDDLQEDVRNYANGARYEAVYGDEAYLVGYIDDTYIIYTTFDDDYIDIIREAFDALGY